MKFSLLWLGEYVDLRSELEGERLVELARRLTDVGLSVEGTSDQAFDIDVTSNRTDCMNHLGVARELAVALGRELRPPAISLVEGAPAASSAIAVAVEDPADCPRYAARVVRGVRVGESPDWLKDHLRSIGQRPINNVVDVTNFVLWETGQPLHAFDLARLRGSRIVVRRARAGEELVTLDGELRKLDPEVLVIADGERAVALAGIMGGRDSEVGAATTDVLVESAHFERRRVRAGARRLGMHTDASHRFERGADPEACARAADRAAALLAEVAGGTVLAGVVDVRAPLPEGFPPRGRLELARLERFAGAAIPAAEVERILFGLGFTVAPGGQGVWNVGVPSWRWHDFPLLPGDLWSAAGENVDEQDLFEEVMRHWGFDKIPASLPAVPGVDEGQSPEHDRRGRIREHLAAAGFAEAINYAFHSAAAARPPSLLDLRREEPPLELANPLSEQFAVMRRSLLPGLVESAGTNQRRGAAAVRLFEIGHVFAGGGAAEVETVALVAGGALGNEWQRRVELDVFDLKGAVESLAAAMGVELRAVPEEIDGLVPGASASLALDGRTVGLLGQLAGGEVPFPLFVAEIEAAACAAAPQPVKVQPPSRHPGIAADLTFTHALAVSWQEIADFIHERRVPDLVDFGLEVRWRGAGVPAGAVNTTIHFLYNAADRSLTQEEVNERHLALAEELRRRFGWQGEGA